MAGDGLPLVAPTPERVDAMLAAGCSEQSADEVIATLPPRGGLVTRRLLAVNAVLAGCPPGLLPVLVTAVRAARTPELNLRGVNATTHPVAPLAIVHGEAVAANGFNAGLGTFGPGCRANATLGRAVRLVLLHLAGARRVPATPRPRAAPRNTPTASPRTSPRALGSPTRTAAASRRRARSRSIAERPRTTSTTWRATRRARSSKRRPA
ncbi:MAG: hypothetical protein R3E53_15310 [Myxococcota bacterium]